MNKKTIMLTERFWSKVNKTNSCWEWIAGIGKDGYGRFRLNERINLAHRLSYEHFKGKIPKGLDLDHLCRNRKCINPEHLEAVTRKINIRRGLTGQHNNHANKLKTHCLRGHEYDEENTYIYSDGRRQCRKCVRIRVRQCRYRKRILTTF